MQNLAKKNAGNAIKALMNLSPKVALLVSDGEDKEVLIDSLLIGDVLLVKPGSQVPIDGEIIEGKS